MIDSWLRLRHVLSVAVKQRRDLRAIGDRGRKVKHVFAPSVLRVFCFSSHRRLAAKQAEWIGGDPFHS